MTAVFDRYPNGGGEMLLALALADHASDDGTRVYPGIKGLAEKTRQSERTVQYQLRHMEEMGWLILVGPGNGGRSMHREYRISLDWIKGADIAPFQKGAIHDTKGATDGVKGATDDTKGCNPQHKRVQPVAPANNRHRTIIEPSEETQSACESGINDAPELPVEVIAEDRKVTMPGVVCMAMKAVGMIAVNPSHPDLLVLIEKGAGVDLFVESAREALKKQKGFAYAIGTVKGQMKDAAELSTAALSTPHANSETTYQKSMRLRVAEFAPDLARAPPGKQNIVEFFAKQPPKPHPEILEIAK